CGAATHRQVARSRTAHFFEPERLQHQSNPAEDRSGNGSETRRTSRRDFFESEIVRAYPAALRQSRQPPTRSGIGLSARALLQGFHTCGREALRYRQGKAQENQYRARDFADPIRTKCFEGKERILGGRRSQGRSPRSFR